MEEDDIMQSALSEMIEGNHQTVIYQTSKLLANNKENYTALVLRGSAYCEKGEYTNAINDFSEAEKSLKELNGDLLYMKGKALFYNQNFEESQKELEKAIKIASLSDEQKGKINCLINKMKFD